MYFIRAIAVSLFFLLPSGILAQGMQVAFGSPAQDPDTPVEVTADSLAINQADGSATFTGNVKILQGTLKIEAPVVDVFYNDDTKAVARLLAHGGVLIVNGDDIAESTEADYNLDDQQILMSGNVLLSQGPSTISSDKMTVDLEANTAQMHGRVKTILKSGDK